MLNLSIFRQSPVSNFTDIQDHRSALVKELTKIYTGSMTNTATRSRVGMLGTLAELHRESIQYDLRALRRLANDLQPDLLCAEIHLPAAPAGASAAAPTGSGTGRLPPPLTLQLQATLFSAQEN